MVDSSVHMIFYSHLTSFWNAYVLYNIFLNLSSGFESFCSICLIKFCVIPPLKAIAVHRGGTKRGRMGNPPEIQVTEGSAKSFFVMKASRMRLTTAKYFMSNTVVLNR